MRRIVTAFLCLLVLASGGLSYAGPPDSGGPSAVVLAFNDAMRAGDAAGVASYLADGGVQFTIKSPHEGFVPEQLTTAIVPYWQMVAPVVASSTTLYERDVEVLDQRAMGNIATVWTQIDTRRQLKGKEEIVAATANHVYLLIQTPDGWKIAGIADNRAVDKIADE